MEFRKMVTIALYAKQKKRHISINKKPIIDFWPPNDNEHSRNCDPVDATPSSTHSNCWGAGECRKQGEEGNRLAPDSWGTYERNEFREPRDLHLPQQRKLNSFTWHLTILVQIVCSLCCKLVYSPTLSPASLEQFSQSYWDALSQAQSPKHSHQIK